MSRARFKQTGQDAVLTDLSEDFRRVVGRIQAHLDDRVVAAIEPGQMVQVEAAEQTVDARALDLQHGQGDRAAWQAALSEYEAAWLNIIRSLGERKN